MINLLTGLTTLLLLALPAATQAAEAINFKFVDRTGKSIQLSDYKGKWVLVNFWAPWCPRCWAEFGDLNVLNKRDDFKVVSIALDYAGDEAAVHTYANRYNLNFPVVIGGSRRDPDGAARQIGPVDFYPTSYLYDPNGEMVMFIPGRFSPPKLLAFMGNHKADVNTATTLAAEKAQAEAIPAPAVPAAPAVAVTPPAALPEPVMAPATYSTPYKAKARRKLKS